MTTSKLILGKIHLKLLMKKKYFYLLGLETLLGLVCFGLFLCQSTALFRNFSSGDTLRTIKEVDHEGPMPSPLVIICQDPGNLNISEDNVRAAGRTRTRTNFTVDKMTTAFKVIIIITCVHYCILLGILNSDLDS